MKLFGAYIMVLSLLLNVGQVDESAIEGYWLNETGDLVVEVYKKDGSYLGKIVWLAQPLDDFGQPLRDVMNEEPRLRPRQVMQLNVLEGFEFDGDDTWRAGSVYNFNSGNKYNAKLEMGDDGNLRLTGYYGILFMLGKTKVWTRVSDYAKYGLN